MKILKTYTAIKISAIEDKNLEQVKVKLIYGDITGPYYNQIYPEDEFDTEQEALEYAYKFDKKAS